MAAWQVVLSEKEQNHEEGPLVLLASRSVMYMRTKKPNPLHLCDRNPIRHIYRHLFADLLRSAIPNVDAFIVAFLL